MPGIAALTVHQLQQRIANFASRYIQDWNEWLATPADQRVAKLGAIMRRWQACRPNRMRRCQHDALHNEPYLEEIVGDAENHIPALEGFDVGKDAPLTQEEQQALVQLWRVLEHLSYGHRVRGGLAGVVGISKAVMLLTEGRIGPAFDSRVRRNLGLGTIATPDRWIHALRVARCDIRGFEAAQGMTLQQAVPQFAHLHSGRIYDMALGPEGAT